MGRPKKYSSIDLKQVEFLSEKGLTDKEMAEFFDVSESTWNNYKQEYPEFLESLKKGKAIADSRVVRSLFERATGYNCPETKAQWVSDLTGHGRWETLNMEKHYPPDPTSMIFWLKNRRPAEWRDKQEIETTGKGEVKVTIK